MFYAPTLHDITNFKRCKVIAGYNCYGLARALVGISWDSLQLSPAVGLLLAHLDPNVPDDLRFLRKVLGQELLRAVLAVDPNAPPHRCRSVPLISTSCPNCPHRRN
jgi:hypothetical protein